MTSKPDPMFFKLQQLVIDLALINRNHHLAGQVRAENDIEHSFMVAILCWYICEKYALQLDVGKVIKYALIHDFTEVYVGDINTYASQKERERKSREEAIALKKLNKEFESFNDFVESINAYENKSDEEALFVWSVDKIQALILADMDNWRPYKKINITYKRFLDKHTEQLKICSPHCREIFGAVLEYCKVTSKKELTPE